MTRIRTPIVLFILLLSGCSNFVNLSNEIEAINTLTNQYTVTLSEPVVGSAVIIQQITDIDEGVIDGYDAIIGGSSIALQMSNDIHYLLLFEDKNKDLTLQPDEAFSVIKLSDYQDKDQIKVTLSVNEKEVPNAFVNRSLTSLLNIEIDLVEIGTVVSLTDPPFAKENAELGMWQPLTFMLNNNTGLYFLSDYDPNKIPILFVHGINSTAADFAPLIEKIDHSKYQVWVFNYPTGLSLSLVSKGLSNLLYTVTSDYNVEQMHIVAHSMGGLVVENYIRQCSVGHLCKSVNSIATISTPFGGVSSAKQGVEYSPVVMPAWVDLNPEGQFIQTLFNDIDSKPKSPHFLLFSYNSGQLFTTDNNDGVIDLSSQLSRPAQLDAEQIRGYNENHLSILDNDNLFEDLSIFWKSTER